MQSKRLFNMTYIWGLALVQYISKSLFKSGLILIFCKIHALFAGLRKCCLYPPQKGKTTSPKRVFRIWHKTEAGGASAILELWWVWSSSSLPLLQGPLWYGVLVFSIGRINLKIICMRWKYLKSYNDEQKPTWIAQKCKYKRTMHTTL